MHPRAPSSSRLPPRWPRSRSRTHAGSIGAWSHMHGRACMAAHCLALSAAGNAACDVCRPQAPFNNRLECA
eukprot:364690-Chlamydomonas_euryale.AAC.9